MKKLAIFISGGSTKIAFLAGVVYTFLQRINKMPVEVVTYVGTSSGYILSAFFAMGKYSTVLRYMPIYSLSMIFGVDPDTRKGKLIMIKNFLIGKIALLEYKGLKKILEREITQEDLDAYRKSKAPDCWGGVVDFETLEELYYNMKDLERVEDVHKLILASASIPIYAPYQELFGRKLYDGGARSHIGNGWAIDNLKGFDYALNVYSRTNNWKDYKEGFKNSFLWVVKRSSQALTLDMSFEDSFKAKEKAKDKGIKMLEIFAPEKLQDSTFEASKEGNLEMIKKGEEEVLKISIRGFFDIN